MSDFDIQQVIDLARSGEPFISTIEEKSVREAGVPVAVLPKGNGSSEIQSVKRLVDEWRTSPERRRGVAQAFTLRSFTDLVNRHKDGHSAIFAQIVASEPKLLAVIDYHQTDGEPRFGEHRIAYDYPISDEWRAWRGKDGAVLSQLDFAAFIEDRVAELASPEADECSMYEGLFQTKIALPTELIQLSRGIAVNVDSKVKEIRNLQSGEAQIIYDEVHKDGAGKPLTIPGLFIIQIPMFVGGNVIRIVARLRYRRQEGMKWFYHLYRWQDAMREHLLHDLAFVSAETELPVFEGKPEA